MDQPVLWLKYLDAKEMKLAGTVVTGCDGEKLGELEGFIMEADSGQPRHIVVAAEWLIKKHFLLPIGLASLGTDGVTLIADLTKERVKRFPSFGKSEFEELDAYELGLLDATMVASCASDDLRIVQDIGDAPPAGWNATPVVVS